MYVNSVGSSLGNQIAGAETEAFALADTMAYIPCDIETLCVGQAFGSAAMLVACGAKGKRAILPNSTMMLRAPISQFRGQASDIAVNAREVMHYRDTLNRIISENTGQPLEKVEQDSSRNRYLTPQQAKEYGLVDKLMKPVPVDPSVLRDTGIL
jgi:ATP-dependent Clp protease protease subunit